MSVEEKEKKSVGEVVRENLQKIIIVIVSLIYIVQGLFTLQTKNATILDILGSIAISVVVGVIISASLNSMGVKDGRKSNAFIQSIKTYGETKERQPSTSTSFKRGVTTRTPSNSRQNEKKSFRTQA